MSLNRTLSYLLSKRQETMLCFSEAVTTAATYLKGAGGQAGDGIPLPKDARIYRIDCWDGTSLKSEIGNESVSQGDRLSLYAQVNGGIFDVYVRINGINTTLVATGVLQNTTLMASVHVQFVG